MATTAEAVNALVRLIRDAPPDVIAAVANGDSHSGEADNGKHLAALREVIAEQHCRLDRQADNHWFPREPVELVSYAADGQGIAESCVANALLMIADLEGGHMDYMDFRWHHSPGRAWFEALPEHYRTPLLDGFAVLFARWDAED